jgi:acetylornithine deacetylase/succinyl-diaminopimelate desuccinylase-like protein
MTAAEFERLTALLSIPSVSARPEHAADMLAAAGLCAEEIRRAGGQARVLPGAVHPLVVGEVPPSPGAGGPGAPRVLIYGHYDVQPAGPAALWTSPPFTPTVRGEHLYARGACDDKGCLFMLIAAVQRLAAAGRLPVRAAFLIDGEEESGGSSAIDHLAADAGGAHAAVIFDGPMVAPQSPAFYVGLRGLVYLRVRVRTGRADAHSGLYGGAALNAAHALMTTLAAALAVEGRLPGALAQGVAPVAAAEREAWGLLPPGGQALADAGLRPADPAAAAQFYPRTVAAPSLDVHGLACGDPEAVRTVIPAEASATLSLRLAPGQRVEAAGRALEELLVAAAPAGAELDVEVLNGAEPALIDPGHPVLVRAAAAVEAAIGWRPLPVRIGGSIPIVAALAARGIPTILTGFYLPEDGMHSPDERIAVANLEVGTRAAMAILESLAQ